MTSALWNGVRRAMRNRNLVEMGLVQVAKAIAEGTVKVTVADLDRLMRLVEFPREDIGRQQTKVVVCSQGSFAVS